MCSIVVLCSERSPQGTKIRSEHIKDHQGCTTKQKSKEQGDRKLRRRDIKNGECFLGKREEKARDAIRHCVLNAP